jgi:nicotinamidase-related amidase
MLREEKMREGRTFMRLSEDQALVVVIDIQGNLAQAMYEKEALFANAARIIAGAKVFGMPIVVTEQMPEKLGPTIPELTPLLTGTAPIRKESFSCCAVESFTAALKTAGRRQILIAGIETHICVYQTVMDLLRDHYEVHIIADAVSSRTARNRMLALQRLNREGAVITSTETILFELLKTAADPRFKDIFRLVK